MAPPTAPVSVPSSIPGSSRASSASSSRNIGHANGSVDRLMDVQPPLRSSFSQSSPPRSSSGDVMPQAEGSADDSGKSTPDVDPQIIEALKSKDRLFVLKLGEQMETLISEKNHSSRFKFTVSPENQYQRLLVHRCAQYYKLAPENDPVPRDKSGARDMTVSITQEGRIPLRRIFELVPAEHTNHPTFKIMMRRSDIDRRRQKSSISRPGSTAGEDGELSDPGPSESGSLGSRSTTSKKRMTIQEREAAYEAARSRIFMNFEEKEKAKERDTSASSSTLSLASASGSGSQSGGAGCSSVSDMDDGASTAPTESEFSVPSTDRRRAGDSGFNSTDSTRSFPPFNTQGSGNGRTSGRASPAFTFPSLYEPPVQTQGYEQHGFMPPPMGYAAPPYAMYFAHQPPQNAGPVPTASPPYLAQYQYFPQYPYAGPPPPPPPQPPHSNSSPSSPVTGPVEGYPQHSTTVPFMGPNTFGWTQPPHPQSQQSRHPLENQPPSTPGHNQSQSLPVQGSPPIMYPYPPYLPPGVVPYPGYSPYFQPPPQAHPPPLHPQSQPNFPVELPSTNGNGPDRGMPSGASSGKGSPSPTLSRHTSSSGNSSSYPNHLNGVAGNRRGMPPTRGAWNIGSSPGIRASLSGPGLQNGTGAGDSVGPRLSSMRRTSGASSNSSGYRTPGDETASVASSSTSSSSSRRTYNNSAPPVHPLPPRPDWAAGIKAQPTLHPPVRHRHDSNNNSRTMSPAHPPQPLQNNHLPSPQQRPPIHLQPTDFPPLSSATSGKRPAPGSAWSSMSPATRAVLSPNPGHLNQSQGNSYGSALFNHPHANSLEDDDRGFERPPPKRNAELYNPKGGAKRTSQTPSPQQSSTHEKVPENKAESAENTFEEHLEPRDTAANAILIGKMESMGIQTQRVESEIENTPRPDSVLSGQSQESNAGSTAAATGRADKFKAP
ncbi:hypothetical protein ACEPAH_3356 [Sanghuangporus vaninii]